MILFTVVLTAVLFLLLAALIRTQRELDRVTQELHQREVRDLWRRCTQLKG